MKNLFIAMMMTTLPVVAWAGPCDHVGRSSLLEGELQSDNGTLNVLSDGQKVYLEFANPSDENYLRQQVGTDTSLCVKFKLGGWAHTAVVVGFPRWN